MKNEIWKEVEGYNGDYLISNLGKVKSLKNNKEKILKPTKNSRGYYVVGLSKNNIKKTLTVHRLVSKAFIPNPENKPQINHIDGCKSNNNVTNLEFCTAKENNQHAWDTGLKENARKANKKRMTNFLRIIGTEASKKPVYSSKLDMQFESRTEAATYIQENYYSKVDVESIRISISDLLLNKRTKSKFDFGWLYI